MSRLEYAQAKFQPGPCVWAASATCACAHTARGTTWRALFSSSPARSWLLLIAAATTTRSAGRLAQASHTCWDEMRNHLATRRIPHDARMAQKSAMRRAMLVSGPCPFQPSGRRAFRCCCELSDGACCAWHTHLCEAGRRRTRSARCGPLRQHAAPRPAQACCRIWTLLLSLFNDHARKSCNWDSVSD